MRSLVCLLAFACLTCGSPSESEASCPNRWMTPGRCGTQPGDGDTCSSFSLLPLARVAMLGDSITNSNYAYTKLPVALKALAGERYVVDQYGIPGDSTAGMLSRFNTDIRGKNYTHVVILGGINDINLGGRTGAATAGTLFSIYAAVADAGFIPVPVTIMPAGGSGAWNGTKQTYLTDANALIRDAGWVYAEAYLDMVVQDGGTALNPLWDADGIHPNEAGVQELARIDLLGLQDAGTP